LTKVTSPELCETGFTYDGSDRITEYVHVNGSKTKYAYEASGKVTTITAPDGGVNQFAYLEQAV